MSERAATIQEVLRAHWLTSVDCDHKGKTDTARCFCTIWTGTPQLSVGAAVEQWIDHVTEMLSVSRTVTAKSLFISRNYAS